MRLVYNVYDDENQIESKQFDNFPDALEYAKQGLITYICEEDLDCPGCEERVVWTWDSTWDDEEAIAEVTSGRENADLFDEVNSFDRANPVSEEPALSEDIEINISGPVEEVRDLASFIFGYEFDLEWDSPIEEVKVDEQDFSDEFGYEDEPAVRDLDFDVDDPFEDDLYYSEEEFGDNDELEDEEDFEVGEPEIVEDPDFGPEEEPEEDQPEELEISKDSEEFNPEADDEENKEDPKKEIDESVEEVKLATNKRGDYLVAADSGKGYTVFSRNDVCIGGFDGEDDQKAIDKFNKGEFKESLKESLNLPTMRASEIKDELDLHGDIYFDLLEPVDESDEDGWRGASEIRIVDTGSGYEVYFEWLDQDGDYIESDPEFTCGTFEELLTEIDGFYVTVVDLEEYSDDTLDEAIKMTKDELLDKEGTTDVDLINAGRPEDERVELAESNDYYQPNRELGGYVVVDTAAFHDGKYWGVNWENKALDNIDHSEVIFDDVFYSSIMTDDLDEAEVYGSVEDALSAIERTISMPGTCAIKREGKKSIKIDWTGTGDHYFTYEVKKLYHYTHSWSELEEQLTEGRQPVYSNVIFYCYDQNDDEQTYTKANMTPIMIRTEVDELVKNGAARVYVEAKINGEWEALDKYTYDPVWTPGTPEYAARNSKDFALALESLDQEDNLTDQEFAEQLQKRLQESQSQEIGREYARLSKEYGIDFEDLVYGEEGFMKTKYPNNFPDFAGDVIYSEKYWNELVKFAKEKGIELN